MFTTFYFMPKAMLTKRKVKPSKSLLWEWLWQRNLDTSIMTWNIPTSYMPTITVVADILWIEITTLQEAKWFNKMVFDTIMDTTFCRGNHDNTCDTAKEVMKGKILGWTAASKWSGLEEQRKWNQDPIPILWKQGIWATNDNWRESKRNSGHLKWRRPHTTHHIPHSVATNWYIWEMWLTKNSSTLNNCRNALLSRPVFTTSIT
jgi:hypothetical protein